MKQESEAMKQESDAMDTAAREAAEAAAAEILQRNLKTDKGGLPPEESFFAGPVRWELEEYGQELVIRADCGKARFRLGFLQDTVTVKGSASAYFFPNPVD